jgi:hypothetical protein
MWRDAFHSFNSRVCLPDVLSLSLSQDLLLPDAYTNGPRQSYNISRH